ncbi:hypothetical protein [Orenia marismortui]|nr:hypothetical protein [Orenia marismortui]
MRVKRAHTRIRAFLIDEISAPRTMTFDINLLPKVVNIQGGTIVGKVSSTGKARLYTKAAIKTAGSSVKDIELEVPITPFVTGDTVSIGENTVNITDVNYDTNIITVDSAVTVAAGDVVSGTDGSEKAIGVLRERMDLVGDFADEDQHGGVLEYAKVIADACDLLDDDAKTELKHIVFRELNR